MQQNHKLSTEEMMLGTWDATGSANAQTTAVHMNSQQCQKACNDGTVVSNKMGEVNKMGVLNKMSKRYKMVRVNKPGVRDATESAKALAAAVPI